MLKRILSFLSLFSSLGTLVCCALPALLVSLGLGATLISVLGTFPQLIWLSEHKISVFIVAGVLLTLSGLSRWVSVRSECPVDSSNGENCRTAKSISTPVFYVSIILYCVGAFFAFVAPYLV
jgi:hypothetical protein